MLQIRKSIFETNSSSTHALVLMSKKQYHDWQNNEHSYLVLHNEGFITPDKVKILLWEDVKKEYEKYYSKYDSNREVTDNDIMRWADWMGYLDSESYNYIYGEYEDLVCLSAYIPE